MEKKNTSEAELGHTLKEVQFCNDAQLSYSDAIGGVPTMIGQTTCYQKQRGQVACINDLDPLLMKLLERIQELEQEKVMYQGEAGKGLHVESSSPAPHSKVHSAPEAGLLTRYRKPPGLDLNNINVEDDFHPIRASDQFHSRGNFGARFQTNMTVCSDTRIF
jgi:hypothetical protein